MWFIAISGRGYGEYRKTRAGSEKMQKMIKKLFIVAAYVLLWSTGVSADQEVAGVKVPGTITVSGKSLALNGVGIRKATFLKIKVYVASLYVESKSSQLDELLRQNELMVLNMDLVRSVSASKLRDGWSAGFRKAPAYSKAIDSKIEKFNAAMQDLSDGDRITIYFNNEGISLHMPGAKTTTIEGEKFKKALLEIWLGPNPPNSDLKEGLLGK
jgi:hypothetical protein